jgi:cyclopropane fatty-acyl-phospholipid synthase-like methyltransferase
MDFFERQWGTYRTVLSHDLMEHRAVEQATATALEHWLGARPPEASPARMVDLGCGDLALLAPLLRRLPLGSYTGVDLTAAVLPLAEQNLGVVPYPVHWEAGDLLQWANTAQESSAKPVEILHSAFAIHHLTDPQKASFLQAARACIADNGLFLWVDVFREPGETREAYLARYSARVQGWTALEGPQQEQVIQHLSQCDIPADREAIVEVARQAGWHWRWSWQGRHQAEAMAVLTPA